MTPEAPERIHGWQHNQMSIARHYGGLRYMGHEYSIAYAEEGTPLVRWDVIKAEAKAKKLAQYQTDEIKAICPACESATNQKITKDTPT